MNITPDFIILTVAVIVLGPWLLLLGRINFARGSIDANGSNYELHRQAQVKTMYKTGYSKLAAGFLFFFATSRHVERMHDAHHSRGFELAEYRLQLRTLRKMSGRRIDEVRQRIEQEIIHIEETPLREAAVDGDDYVAQITPHLEQMRLGSAAAEKMFVDDRRKKLGSF